MIKAGDRITVHAPKSFADDAIVASICHVDNLPELPGFPAAEVRDAIQSGGHFTHVALIEYKFLDQPLCFAAFLDRDGQWWDLKGTPLIIEPRTAENLSKPPEAARNRLRLVSRGIDWSKF